MSHALLVRLQVLAREVKALRKQLEVEKQQAAAKEAEHAARESERLTAEQAAAAIEPAAVSSAAAAAAEAQPAAAAVSADEHVAVPSAAQEPTGAEEQAASDSLAATPAASTSAVEVASTAAVSYAQLLQEVVALRQRLHDSSIEVVAGKHLAMCILASSSCLSLKSVLCFGVIFMISEVCMAQPPCVSQTQVVICMSMQLRCPLPA